MLIIGCLFFGRSIISERFEAFEHFLSILICHKHPHINMPYKQSLIISYLKISHYCIRNIWASCRLHNGSTLKHVLVKWQSKFQSNVATSCWNGLAERLSAHAIHTLSAGIAHISAHSSVGVFLGNRQDSHYPSLIAIWLVLASIFFYDFETTNLILFFPMF